MRSGSAMIVPTRLRGLSEAYGSWNTICISRRTGRSWRRDRREMSRPSKRDRAAGQVVEPDDAPGQRGLAAPGLADQPERLPGAHLEADVVHRVHPRDLALQDALPDREVLLDVLGPRARISPSPGRSPRAPRSAPARSARSCGMARSCRRSRSGRMARSRCSFFCSGSRWQASRWPSPSSSVSSGTSAHRSNRCAQRGAERAALRAG